MSAGKGGVGGGRCRRARGLRKAFQTLGSLPVGEKGGV